MRCVAHAATSEHHRRSDPGASHASDQRAAARCADSRRNAGPSKDARRGVAGSRSITNSLTAWLVSCTHTGSRVLDYNVAVARALAGSTASAVLLDDERGMQWHSPRRPAHRLVGRSTRPSSDECRPDARGLALAKIAQAKRDGSWESTTMREALVIPGRSRSVRSAYKNAARHFEAFRPSRKKVMLIPDQDREAS